MALHVFVLLDSWMQEVVKVGTVCVCYVVVRCSQRMFPATHVAVILGAVLLLAGNCWWQSTCGAAMLPTRLYIVVNQHSGVVVSGKHVLVVQLRSYQVLVRCIQPQSVSRLVSHTTVHH